MLSKPADIRLIAVDLDGTLLGSDGEVVPENKEAIKRAKAAGIRVVICTGRPLRSMTHLIEELDFTDANDLVCVYNGGLIQYANSGEILHQETLNKKDVQILKKEFDRLNMPIVLVDLNVVYEPAYPNNRPSIYYLDKKVNPPKGWLEFHAIDVDEMPDDWVINKLAVARPQEEVDAIVDQIDPTLHEKYNIFKTQDYLLEAVPKNIDKGFAISYLQEHFGLANEQVMAIGDEENDLPLVQAAGFGVAMGNAIDKVKTAAQFVTKTNDEAGVAYAIDYVLS